MDLIRCESLYPWENMDMPSARFPRFRRAPPIMLTKSDREVIRRVFELPFPAFYTPPLSRDRKSPAITPPAQTPLPLSERLQKSQEFISLNLLSGFFLLFSLF